MLGTVFNFAAELVASLAWLCCRRSDSYPGAWPVMTRSPACQVCRLWPFVGPPWQPLHQVRSLLAGPVCTRRGGHANNYVTSGFLGSGHWAKRWDGGRRSGGRRAGENNLTVWVIYPGVGVWVLGPPPHFESTGVSNRVEGCPAFAAPRAPMTFNRDSGVGLLGLVWGRPC